MATSGSFTTANGYTSSSGSVYKLTFAWERTSYSIENNTSTIKWTLKGYSTGTGYVKAQNLVVKIDGTTIWSRSVSEGQTNMYNNTVIATGSHTIKHNSDGTKSFSAYIEGGLYVWAPANATGTKSFTLNTIPRASTISATNVNIGSQTTITVKKATSSFTHTITYVFGNLSGTIATKSSSTTIKWTVPTDFYGQIPSSKTGVCTLTCETFNGSTSLGKKNVKFTVTAAESLCKPVLAPTAKDTNSITVALTGNNSKLIKGFSNVDCAVNATARNSATIKSTSIKNNKSTISANTASFGAVTVNTFTFGATDSRGYTTTQDITLDMVNYIKPTCLIVDTEFTTDGVIKFKIKGSVFTGSFGAVSNSLLVQYRYKTKSGTYGDWISITATKETNAYSANVELTELDYREQYVIQAKITDELVAESSNEITLSCIPVFDWSEDNFNFNVPVHLNDTEVLRINDDKKVVLAAENDIYLRPNGTDVDEGQLRLTTGGKLILNGRTLPHIATGTATIKYGSSAGSVAIDFGVTYAAKPVVITSQVFDSANILVNNNNITTTGFTAVVQGGFSSSGSRAFSWVAIGTLA